MQKMRMLFAVMAVMLAVCTGAAADGIPEEYCCSWAWAGLVYDGTETALDSVSEDIFKLCVHEDAVALVQVDDGNVVAQLSELDDGLALVLDEWRLPMRVDDQDRLILTMGELEECIMIRSEQPVLEAGLMPLAGYWIAESAELFGYRLSAQELGLFYLHVYPDGCSTVRFGEDTLAGRLENKDGRVCIESKSVRSIDITLDAQGQMVMTMDVEGILLTVYLTRTDAVPRYVVITSDKGILRAEPDVSSTYVRTAQKGESFTYLGEEANWYIVDVDGRRCYVSKSVSGLQ